MKKNYFLVGLGVLVYLILVFVNKGDTLSFSKFLGIFSLLGTKVYDFLISFSFRELEYVYYLAILCFIILLKDFLSNKDRKNSIYLYLIIYLVVLLGFVFSSRSNLITKSRILMYQTNFIPFKSIIENFNSILGVSFGLYNIIGNFLMLTPLVILLPLVVKLDKKKMFLTLLVVSLTIEVMQLILNIGAFDIDDIILNVGGAYLLYLIILKTKFNYKIEYFFLNYKVKKIKITKIIINILLFIYLTLSVLFLTIFINNLINEVKINKIDLSNLVCVNNKSTYIVDRDNYHLYTKCKYDGFIKVGNQEVDIYDYLKMYDYNSINSIITRKRIITNIKVIKNNDYKLVRSTMYGKLYLVNILDMIYTIDGINYSYFEKIQEMDRNETYDISFDYPSELIYLDNNGSSVSKNEYYYSITCKEDKFSSISNTYITNLDLKITKDVCLKLNKKVNS